MGTYHEELQYSCDLILQYAFEACGPGHDLHPDVQYGADLVKAAPDMLAALSAFADEWDRGPQWVSDDTADRITRAIAKANGET